MKTWVAIAMLGCVPSLAMAIRCGNQIVGKGTSSAELIAYCGNPSQVDHGASYNTPAHDLHGGSDSGVVEHQVEFWTYNFGPNMLMERIRLEDGVVVDIQSLGYGFNEP